MESLWVPVDVLDGLLKPVLMDAVIVWKPSARPDARSVFRIGKIQEQEKQTCALDAPPVYQT